MVVHKLIVVFIIRPIRFKGELLVHCTATAACASCCYWCIFDYKVP